MTAAQPGLIPVSAARALARNYKCPMVVIYGIDRAGERFSVTTYGETQKLCRAAADVGRKISEGVLGGAIAPAREEPTDLPLAPETWRGPA